MKLKRKKIVRHIDARIQAIDRAIVEHDRNRKASLKITDTAGAGYHWGRCSGLVAALTELRTIREMLISEGKVYENSNGNSPEIIG